MRRNKKIKKNSIFKTGSVSVVIWAITAFAALMIYWQMASTCTAISREIGELEKQHKKLEDECVREAARWSKMKTRDRLDETLSRFGIQMEYPRADQVVKMTADGRPAPKQLSVARLKARAQTSTVAMLTQGATTKERIRPALTATASSSQKGRRKAAR